VTFHKRILEWQAAHPNITSTGWPSAAYACSRHTLTNVRSVFDTRAACGTLDNSEPGLGLDNEPP
jgi:hypothetical protein